MKKYKSKKGWYKLVHPEKFLKVLDETMQSSKDGYVQYKSSLELKFLRYCDLNKYIKNFSLEPFPIPYVKPTDGKVHRYYIDFYVEFITGHKVLIEIKSYNETVKPQKPNKLTPKNIQSFNEALQTYIINLAKWKACKEFADNKGLKFMILTENELG